MIKSMTGFASITCEEDQGTIGVTIRAVNHRYLDLQLRTPSAISDRDSVLRSAVQRRVARGRIELNVSVQAREQPVPQVDLNAPFVVALQTALQEARDCGLVEGRLAPGDLLRLPQALTIREAAVSASPALADAVERAVDRALDDLDQMRAHEGAQLQTDFARRRVLLEELIERLASAAADGRAALEGRLHERVRELAADLSIERAALAQEIVRMAARSDISEEITRFKAHLVHWDTLSHGPEPCGRKLDFLLQEMNREINTIGSKADGSGVSELIVTAKAELEKLREQVQNVE
jgi:uncharacterized protein (TIGR00255 family)